jgi:hypothetical protein
MHQCPNCAGVGKNFCFVDGRKADGSSYGDMREVGCSTCAGTGKITPERARYIQIGKAMRDARVAMGAGLLERARDIGIGPAELSKIERGEGPPSAYEELL